MEKHDYVYDETVDSIIDKEEPGETGSSYPTVFKGVCCTMAVIFSAMLVAFFKGTRGRKQAGKLAKAMKKNKKCPFCLF